MRCECVPRQKRCSLNFLLSGKPVFLEDCTGATFFYRSTQSTKLPNKAKEFYLEVIKLLGHELEDKAMKRMYSSENRGPHLPNVIGHYRQYKKVSG